MKIFNKTNRDSYEPTKQTINKNSRIHKPLVILEKPSSSQINFHSIPSLSEIDNSKLRVAFWSTWKTACGIAVYTEHLANALEHHHVQVFPYSNSLSPEKLLLQTDTDRPHIINIQYEPAIVPGPSQLIALIRELRNRRIKVALTYHSESEATKQLCSVSDLSIFHRIPQRVDLGRSIIRLPMGVPVFNPLESKSSLRKKYGFSNRDKILVTTGFMFTWKQQADILARLTPYLKNDKHLKVQLLTAFNSVNPGECVLEKENIEKVIRENSLEAQVFHITDFLSQEELSERLYLSDLGYLWSGIITTSTSAAGKEFITARLPLVATTSTHYHDLTIGTVKTEMNKELFISKIIETINNKNLLNDLSEKMDLHYSQINNNNVILQHLEAYKKC